MKLTGIRYYKHKRKSSFCLHFTQWSVAGTQQ